MFENLKKCMLSSFIPALSCLENLFIFIFYIFSIVFSDFKAFKMTKTQFFKFWRGGFCWVRECVVVGYNYDHAIVMISI